MEKIISECIQYLRLSFAGMGLLIVASLFYEILKISDVIPADYVISLLITLAGAYGAHIAWLSFVKESIYAAHPVQVSEFNLSERENITAKVSCINHALITLEEINVGFSLKQYEDVLKQIKQNKQYVLDILERERQFIFEKLITEEMIRVESVTLPEGQYVEIINNRFKIIKPALSSTKILGVHDKLVSLGISHNSMTIAVCIKKMADYCSESGQLDEAEKLYKLCLAIYTNILGENHPNTRALIKELLKKNPLNPPNRKQTHRRDRRT